MQRKKTREEVVTMPYLTKSDICTLLNASYPVAARIYKFAKEIDDAELKYPIYANRVRIKSVCKVTGTDINLLMRQTKREAENAEKKVAVQTTTNKVNNLSNKVILPQN